MEVTGHYSGVYWDEENLFGGESMEDVQNHLGIQVESGLGNYRALRFRLERITLSNADDDDDSAFMVYSAGPKFGSRSERLAVYLPVGFATSEGMESSESWQIHPTVILGFPFGRDMELIGSGKLLIPIGNDNDVLFAANVGLGIGMGSLVIRPETGFLMNPGENGYFKQFSLGVSFRGGD